jgi:transcriptional regulator with XRE-family HTH domain
MTNFRQFIAVLSSSKLPRPEFMLLNMEKSAKILLSAHLKLLMASHPALSDRKALSARTGVSERTIGYMLQPDTGNPTLASIESVAKAYGLRAWELLIDRESEKERLMAKIFGTAIPDEKLGKDWAVTRAVHQSGERYRRDDK